MGVEVVAIGMGLPEVSRLFKERHKITFPFLSDPGQKAYQAFGLGIMNPVAELMGGSGRALLRETLAGNFVGVPVGDVTQLGGSFLVNREGKALYVRRDQTSSSFPSGQELVKIIQKILPEIKAEP